MNRVINAFKALPLWWQVAVVVGVLAVVLGTGYWAVSGVQRWVYNRHRAQFEAERQVWAVERAKLLQRAEDDERRIAELEPQVAAFKTAAEQGRKIDKEKADEIQEVIAREAAAERAAQVPVDCWVRASRVCELFRANDKRFDCTAIFDACK